MPELHPRRIEILEFLARRRSEEPPSIAEVACAVRLRSTQTAHHHLVRLESEGYIERLPSPSSRPARKRRPVRLTERGWRVVGSAPMMGRIAAGRGLEAIADEEAYSLAGELLNPGSGKRRYLLRVVGQSMTGAGIRDGDLLVVEEDPDPPDGSVVVALLAGGDEVTVKRLFRENGAVRLKAENGLYEDIVLPAGEVEVQGRVCASIHNF